MLKILSVDVEDWFQAEAQSEAIKFADWDNCELRVLPNVTRLLDLFDRYGVRATFFVLGWVAEKLPNLVDLIATRGHEIGSHGHTHQQAGRQNREEFSADVRRSLEVIRESVDTPIRGYRAPSFSIGERTPWAWKILADQGFAYDSSVFPIRHDIYGSPDLPRHPFRLDLEDGRVINEIPLTTIRIMGYNLPAAGGGYLRLFPYWYTQRAINKVNRAGFPAVVYLHPWEIDPDQPRTKLSILNRFRHYTNLGTTEYKLERLLSDFRFSTAWEYLQQNDPETRPRLTINTLSGPKPIPPSKCG